MNVTEIRQIARQHGVKPGKLSKIEMVREIQRAEGNFDCFGTANNSDCDQFDCLWRKDCFNTSRNIQ
jgi:hypothetical protein